jgi:short-subunit dehydrogenase
MNLSGKLVLLTGASSGLGPVIARRLRRDGARLVLSARREPELRRLAGELGDAEVVTADLSKPGEAERLAEAAGHIDVLVANAGLPGTGLLESFSPAQIDSILNVNLRSAIVLSRLLVPAMVKRNQGHVVLMSSIAGVQALPSTSLYNATKFGLRGFGLALRQELAPRGVGVSVIMPTFVSEAGMWAETGLKAHPLAGEVTPDQVAVAVHSAIVRDRGEVRVGSVMLRTSLVMASLAPGLAERVTAASGAAQLGARAAERHTHKR